MSEPTRPPPPKAYVPLAHSDKPPEPPPRPKIEEGENPPIPIPPRPYGSDAAGSSEDTPSCPPRKKRGPTPPAPPAPYSSGDLSSADVTQSLSTASGSQGRPPPPATRPQIRKTSGPAAPSRPSRPPSVATASAGKTASNKPEITIVSAQPMDPTASLPSQLTAKPDPPKPPRNRPAKPPLRPGSAPHKPSQPPNLIDFPETAAQGEDKKKAPPPRRAPPPQHTSTIPEQPPQSKPSPPPSRPSPPQPSRPSPPQPSRPSPPQPSRPSPPQPTRVAPPPPSPPQPARLPPPLKPSRSPQVAQPSTSASSPPQPTRLPPPLQPSAAPSEASSTQPSPPTERPVRDPPKPPSQPPEEPVESPPPPPEEPNESPPPPPVPIAEPKTEEATKVNAQEVRAKSPPIEKPKPPPQARSRPPPPSLATKAVEKKSTEDADKKKSPATTPKETVKVDKTKPPPQVRSRPPPASKPVEKNTEDDESKKESPATTPTEAVKPTRKPAPPPAVRKPLPPSKPKPPPPSKPVISKKPSPPPQTIESKTDEGDTSKKPPPAKPNKKSELQVTKPKEEAPPVTDEVDIAEKTITEKPEQPVKHPSPVTARKPPPPQPRPSSKPMPAPDSNKQEEVKQTSPHVERRKPVPPPALNKAEDSKVSEKTLPTPRKLASPPGRPSISPSSKPARPGGPPKPPPPSEAKVAHKPPRGEPPVPAVRRGSKNEPTRKVSKDGPPPLPPRPPPGHPLYHYVCTEPHGIAKTVYESYDPEELSFQGGDVIELLEHVDEYWYYARNVDNDDQEGMILASNMKIVKRMAGEDAVTGFEEGPCAVATYKFEGIGDDELSFDAGVLIMLSTRVGSDWLRGRLLDGNEGIFPKEYVEIVEELPEDAYESPPPMSKSPSPGPFDGPVGPYCVAIDQFIAETGDDLSFEPDDVIELLERVDDSWLKGYLNGRVGMFPQVFVKIERDLPTSQPADSKPSQPAESKPSQPADSKPSQPSESKPSQATESKPKASDNDATALFDFAGEDGELTFKEGDVITVLSRVNEDWLYGKLKSGNKEGAFPASFIDRVPDGLPEKKNEEPVEKATVKTGKCEAIFDFDSESAGELNFKAGDIITTTEWINDEWLEGKIGGQSGIFPLAFVKVLEELPKVVEEKVAQVGTGRSSGTTATTTGGSKTKKQGDDNLLPRAVAKANYQARSDVECSLKVGDSIILLESISDQLLYGENETSGNFGEFPSRCVDIIVPLPSSGGSTTTW